MMLSEPSTGHGTGGGSRHRHTSGQCIGNRDVLCEDGRNPGNVVSRGRSCGFPVPSSPGAGLADRELATVPVIPVELADGVSGEGLIGEFDEAEPAGLAGVAIGDDRSRGDVPVVGEQRSEVGLGRAEWEIPNIDVYRIRLSERRTHVALLEVVPVPTLLAPGPRTRRERSRRRSSSTERTPSRPATRSGFLGIGSIKPPPLLPPTDRQELLVSSLAVVIFMFLLTLPRCPLAFLFALTLMALPWTVPVNPLTVVPGRHSSSLRVVQAAQRAS